VIKVEGLRSQKAIAFIKSNPITRLNTKTYSTVRAFLQDAKFSKQEYCAEIEVSLNEKLGEKKWKK
jgi:hypothetical protein